MPCPPGTTTDGYPDAVLLPGLVNVHTHLELTGLRDAVQADGFADWIHTVRRAKDTLDTEGYERAAHEGVREAWRYGTTTVADTGTSGATVTALGALGGRGIYYQEAIQPDPARAAAAFDDLVHRLADLRLRAAPGIAIGVSPHAPYTVSPALYREVAAYARHEGLPVASHVAESAAETALLTEGSGPFAEGWRRRGFPPAEPARSAAAYLDRLGLLGEELLAIHVVQADDRDVALLAERGVAVAVCPRSNRRHGHGAPPLVRFLAAGLRVGLGTDSAVSVPSLDLLAEARAVRQTGDVEASRLVELLTVDAARALGMEGTIGALEPGKWADVAVFGLTGADGLDAATLAARLLDEPAPVVRATYVAGRRVAP